MGDAGIVRNRAKIDASVRSARAYLDIMEDRAVLAVHLGASWTAARCRTTSDDPRDVPAETDASRKLSKALKQAGFNFVGPTIVYAFMQAVGMVNDHLVGCFRHEEVKALGKAL